MAKPEDVSNLNQLARLLASDEAAELRNPARAVELARRAVEAELLLGVCFSESADVTGGKVP